MSGKSFLARDPAALLFLVVTAVLATVGGISLGQPVLLPILAAVPAILVFLDRVRNERLASALWLTTAWSAALAVSVVVMTCFYPEASARAILRGPEYRDEMLQWIRTGAGRESDPRRFLPEHALHYGLFLVLSALTGGVGGLLMGTILINYMSFYVGSLFLADAGANDTLRLALMGWPVWAVARVIGFIAGGVAMAWLSKTLIDRLRDRPGQWPGRSSYYLSLSLALVILDALLKALLAPWWRQALQQALS